MKCASVLLKHEDANEDNPGMSRRKQPKYGTHAIAKEHTASTLKKILLINV